MTAKMHCPHVLAVALADVVEKRLDANAQKRYLRFLGLFERPAGLATRLVTGYFVVVKAVKPAC